MLSARLLVGLLALSAGAGIAAAQETGSIAGRVVISGDSAVGRPLVSLDDTRVAPTTPSTPT